MKNLLLPPSREEREGMNKSSLVTAKNEQGTARETGQKRIDMT